MTQNRGGGRLLAIGLTEEELISAQAGWSQVTIISEHSKYAMHCRPKVDQYFCFPPRRIVEFVELLRLLVEWDGPFAHVAVGIEFSLDDLKLFPIEEFTSQ